MFTPADAIAIRESRYDEIIRSAVDLSEDDNQAHIFISGISKTEANKDKIDKYTKALIKRGFVVTGEENLHQHTDHFRTRITFTWDNADTIVATQEDPVFHMTTSVSNRHIGTFRISEMNHGGSKLYDSLIGLAVGGVTEYNGYNYKRIS